MSCRMRTRITSIPIDTSLLNWSDHSIGLLSTTLRDPQEENSVVSCQIGLLYPSARKEVRGVLVTETRHFEGKCVILKSTCRIVCVSWAEVQWTSLRFAPELSRETDTPETETADNLAAVCNTQNACPILGDEDNLVVVKQPLYSHDERLKHRRVKEKVWTWENAYERHMCKGQSSSLPIMKSTFPLSFNKLVVVIPQESPITL